MNTYRSYPDQPKAYSRLYVVWAALKKLITDAWRWWNWDNCFYLLLSILILITSLILVVVCIGGIFMPHNMTGCYVDHTDNSGLVVVQNIEWYIDSRLKVCGSDLECTKEVLESDLCKPYSGNR